MSDPITKISYTSDGTTTEYDVPFVYLSRGFVKVYINGFATTLFTWLTPTRIKLKRSPDAESTILIQRETQLEPMVVFKDATNLTATDLNMLTNQALHLIQEGHNHITTLEMTGLANNEEFVLPPLDALSVLGILQGRISALELESGLNDRIDLIDASDNNLIDRMSIAEDSIDSLVTQIGSLAYSPYNAETTYALNDVISFEGKLYKSLQADNLGNAPDELESTYWLKISDAADLGAAINYEAATRLSDVGALAYQDAQLQATFDKLAESALANVDSLQKVEAKVRASYKASVDALATESEARVQAIESLQSSFETDLNNVNTTLSSSITNLQTTVANGDSANATAISQLSSTVGTNTTAIETVAETTDGINAKYTVKVDANGYVVGYGLIANAAKDNNPPDSAFIIKADKFAFGYPGYQGAYPFQIGVVDGVSRVGVNGELLVDGTIGANKIKTNELVVGDNIAMGDNAYISWGKVSSVPTNISNLSGTEAILNGDIRINSDGTLSGAGSGQVTIGGLGYTGALNATSNTIYRQTSAPTGGSYTSGDLWIDTDAVPTTISQWNGTSWVIIGNYTTNSNQLIDGANWSTTALWSGVTGSGKPTDNATKNVIYRQTSKPTGGTYSTGDLWVDTDSNPTATYQWDGGDWSVISNYTTNTNQLTDGAGLGTTALWTSVAGRPNTTYIDSNGIYTGTLTANQVNVWDSIQSASPAYVAGIQGWLIDKYGQCEFQNIKARGDIEATSLKAATGTFSGNLDAATGTLGALTVATSGNIKSGKTSYTDTTAGFYLGNDAGTSKFIIGNSTNYLRWTGTALEVGGQIIARGNIIDGSVSSTNRYNNASAYAVTGGTSWQNIITLSIYMAAGETADIDLSFLATQGNSSPVTNFRVTHDVNGSWTSTIYGNDEVNTITACGLPPYIANILTPCSMHIVYTATDTGTHNFKAQVASAQTNTDRKISQRNGTVSVRYK